MIIVIILAIFVTLFEVSFREIVLFQHVSLLFLTVNTLFWFRRYVPAFVMGCVGGVLIDLLHQGHFGETVFSLFLPLLILSFFDSILQLESRLSRLFFSILGTSVSIFVLNVLLELIFWEGNLVVFEVVKTAVVSSLIVAGTHLFFGKYLGAETKKGDYLV